MENKKSKKEFSKLRASGSKRRLLSNGNYADGRHRKKASEEVEKAMHEKKRGKLKSGSGKKVKSRKQAIAIGLSKARKKGAKVPPKK